MFFNFLVFSEGILLDSFCISVRVCLYAWGLSQQQVLEETSTPLCVTPFKIQLKIRIETVLFAGNKKREKEKSKWNVSYRIDIKYRVTPLDGSRRSVRSLLGKVGQCAVTANRSTCLSRRSQRPHDPVALFSSNASTHSPALLHNPVYFYLFLYVFLGGYQKQCLLFDSNEIFP